MPIPFEPGYVSFGPKVSFNLRPPGVRFGRRCEASSHKRWESHPYEISNFPQCSGVLEADASARGRSPEQVVMGILQKKLSFLKLHIKIRFQTVP